MTGPRISKEQQRVIDLFPGALRALITAELAAGNRIIHAGAGHPAPPVGEQVMFAEDLKTRKKNEKDGLILYERESSSHHQEITDERGFFWILTAPLPPPPDADMNAIRVAQGYKPAPVVIPYVPPGVFEVDQRGEMLIYHEGDRSTNIIWTWSQGSRLHRYTINAWWDKKEKRSIGMSEEEKDRVLKIFMDFAKANISSDTVAED